MSDIKNPIPQHVAIIMDGNGRWAKQRGLPRLAGHKAGTENLRRVIRAAKDIGIKFEERFAGKTIVRVNISDAVKRADAIMNKIDAHLAQIA